MNDYFCVGFSSKTVATALQLGAKFFEIVNFAIQRDPDRFLGVGHRLMTAGEVND